MTTTTQYIIEVPVPVYVSKFIRSYFGSDLFRAVRNEHPQSIRMTILEGEPELKLPNGMEKEIIRVSVSKQIYSASQTPLFSEDVINSIARHIHSIFLTALINYVEAYTDQGFSVEKSIRKFLDKYKIYDYDSFSAARFLRYHNKFRKNGNSIPHHGKGS